MKKDYLADVGLLVILFVLIIIRIIFKDADIPFVKTVGYIGCIIAFADLYFDAKRKFDNEDKFTVIRGATIVITVILSIILTLMLTNVISINDVWSDVFTLAALCISLPSQFYLRVVEIYIKGK